MDLNDHMDFAKLINSKGSLDNVTPHKIAVVGFIREFGLLKLESKSMTECIVAPKYRKDFCILALKLIQCPDMEFKELENLLTNGKYNLLSVHLQNFCVCLQDIYVNGVSALTDCVTSTIDRLMIEQSETNPCLITRSSVLGFYLRRVMLQLDKLTFVQLVSLYKSFCLYYQKGRPGMMIRSLSKEKLNNMEPNQTQATDECKNEISLKMALIDRDPEFEEGQWSKKQAELFTAQQATLLQINENKALPPKQLQKTINVVINDLPEFSDVHFLSFLNCMRMKEFSGAQDSLYNCFDRAIVNTPANSNANCNDRNKHYRYAALNRAAMHTQFGHNEVAMEGVSEAMAMAHQAGDAAGMAAAAAWGARAGGAAGRALLPRSARAPRAAAAAAISAHLLAQHRAVNGTRPAQVFSIVTKGDSINYLHSMTDLTLASLANTAALWSLYGKTEMASVYCQLLLNLNTKTVVAGGAVFHWTEASGAAAAGLAALAAARGEPVLAETLVSHHPAPITRQIKLIADANYSLYAGKLSEAHQTIQQLASYDRWESQYLKAEMLFLKGNPTDSIECLHDILDNCKTEDDTLHVVSIRLRAMILKSQVQQSYCGSHSMDNTNILLLNDVLSIAKKYYLHFIAALAEMHIANIQLHLGLMRGALKIVRRVLPTVLAHGGAYDMARALLLYAKCRMACAPTSGEERVEVLQICCGILDSVKKHFQKVGAQARLLETWYLQAQLYNEMGNITARNQCAWMFRQLEAQNPLEHTNSLKMLY